MVTGLVDELLDEGAIYEGATVDAPRGRRPKMLYVRTRDRLVVAVDVRFTGRTSCSPTSTATRSPARRSRRSPTRPRSWPGWRSAIGALLATTARGAAARASGWWCRAWSTIARDASLRPAARLARRRRSASRSARAVGLPVQIENAPLACALAHVWLGTRGGDGAGRLRLRHRVGRRGRRCRRQRRGRARPRQHGRRVRARADRRSPARTASAARGAAWRRYTSNLATISRYLGQRALAVADAPRAPGRAGSRSRTSSPARRTASRAPSPPSRRPRATSAPGSRSSSTRSTRRRSSSAARSPPSWDRLAPIIRRGIAERRADRRCRRDAARAGAAERPSAATRRDGPRRGAVVRGAAGGVAPGGLCS